MKHFAVYFVYVGSLLLVRKYRHFLKGAIGLADVEAILVLSLFLELKYLLLIIVISLLFVVVIGGLLQVLKSKLMYKRFDNELPYIPLLYGSLAVVTWMLYY